MANHQTTKDIFLKIDFRLTQDDVKLPWEGLCRHYIMNSRWHTINAQSRDKYWFVRVLFKAQFLNIK